MYEFFSLIRRFRKDERGVFMVIFAILAIVLIATSGAVVDFTRIQQARTRAQTALDAAALALQGNIYNDGVTAATLKTEAQTLLTERINDDSITAVVSSATPDKAIGKLMLSGYIQVPTYFVQLVGIPSIRATMQSEVTQQSSNIEVSLSLDITGSMSGSKITSLKNASKLLISSVIKDTQTPTYTRMAIVPWAAGVNVGTYAANVRGTPVGSRTISSVTYRSATSKTVSGITRANPGVITVNNTTGLSNGTWVYITGVSGMTQINGKWGQVASLDTSAKTFRLNVSGTNLCTSSGCGYSSWTSGGTVWVCATTNCEEVVTTSTNHDLETDDYTYISGTSGMSSFNNGSNQAWQIRKLSNTTFAAVGSTPNNGIRTSGGTSQCAEYGCQKFFFENASGGWNLWDVNTCVSERTTNPYNDQPPTTTLLAMNYLPASPTFTAQCHNAKIQPLTDDKATLNGLIDTLAIAGSTAGHLGLAWGWYMISPNFAYLWPTGTHQFRPDTYGKSRLVKAIIFMTDGEFNIPYNSGVVSKDSVLGVDLMSMANRINANAVNGSSKSQAETLCEAIKDVDENADGEPDILLYTVGFDLASSPDALALLRDCATSTDFFFQADNGTALENAFKQIGRSLSELRISK